ncbi:MAG: HAMP domain-containing sensor histidine kinase [Pseudomonadota bacterium]
MSRLHVRLAVALAFLMLVVGAIFYWLESRGSFLYHAELTQRLNSSVGMYVADQGPLITAAGVDNAALETLTQRAMVINPTAEIYVLDTQGNVLGDRIVGADGFKARIAIAPIKALLAGDVRLPVFGEDPRVGANRKVFSASEIRSDAGLQGYVYVVLGGQQYAAALSDVASGYQQRLVATAVILTLLSAVLIGAGLFWWLTRPLRRLMARAQSLELEHASDPQSTASPSSATGDELAQLSSAFSRMQARIEGQFSRLQQSDRLRRELITNVSHDLRTPLAAMQGAVDTLLIKRSALTEEQASHLLKTARRHAERLNTLIKDLFELTRLDTGNIQPVFETFSMAELVNDVATEFALKAESRGITLHVAPPPSATTVYADIGLIQRVLENLIDNAVKYTGDGGTVSVAMQPVARGHAVSVSDNGVGISEQHLPRIFERHYAGSRDGENTSDSTGIGLAIVKKILDLHNTSITVNSMPRQGSQFRFELPAAQRAA